MYVYEISVEIGITEESRYQVVCSEILLFEGYV